jgi:hypothetical protein
MLAGDPTEAAEKAEEFLDGRSLSSFYEDVALKGLQLAQADLERGALDLARLTRIKDTVYELVDDLADHADREPVAVAVPEDAETAAAIETIPPHTYPEIPVLEKAELKIGWQSDHPILCIGSRTPLDEAAAIMLAQLCGAHGLAARVEAPQALSTANIFKLDAAGTALVCLSYLAAESPAHMRFAIRRLRRKLPYARILVGAWGQDVEHARRISEAVRADWFVTSLREAVRLSVMEAKADEDVVLGDQIAAQA